MILPSNPSLPPSFCCSTILAAAFNLLPSFPSLLFSWRFPVPPAPHNKGHICRYRVAVNGGTIDRFLPRARRQFDVASRIFPPEYWTTGQEHGRYAQPYLIIFFFFYFYHVLIKSLRFVLFLFHLFPRLTELADIKSNTWT